jgi:hypothetical protein
MKIFNLKRITIGKFLSIFLYYYLSSVCRCVPDFGMRAEPRYIIEEVHVVAKGAVYKILQEVYKARCLGDMDIVRQRIIRVQISLKTGLNLRDYTPETEDSEEDIQRILDIVRGPGIGLRDYEYNGGGTE